MREREGTIIGNYSRDPAIIGRFGTRLLPNGHGTVNQALRLGSRACAASAHERERKCPREDAAAAKGIYLFGISLFKPCGFLQLINTPRDFSITNHSSVENRGRGLRLSSGGECSSPSLRFFRLKLFFHFFPKFGEIKVRAGPKRHEKSGNRSRDRRDQGGQEENVKF